jgi:MFS transporter, DHA2 family, multidrug resistance protein
MDARPETNNELSRPATQHVTAGTWAAFAVLCVGMFMAILDIQVVATSLPAIQSALNIDLSHMSWVQTAYLIAEVIAIPLTGLLTRALTLRWLFVTAMTAFTLASLGCAYSSTFGHLIAWRILQGFAGGTLIPTVFSAVFLMFPDRSQALATTIAGIIAVLAPTIGPLIGGYITATYSWPWLFLINVPIGMLVILIAPGLLPRAPSSLNLLARLDWVALLAIATALAALEIALKEAPELGWFSSVTLALLATSAILAGLFVSRSLSSRVALVDLTTFADRNFALGCALSFVLGLSLYGSVYLIPVFLVFVRGHDAFETGQIMLVTGLAQLATAPIAVALERRVDPRILTAFGFGLLTVGIGLSARQTIDTDFDEMLVPQIVRGVAFMFCLLPPTRLALGGLVPTRVPDASGLFNLMRNLGGAVGIAVIDSILFGWAKLHGESLAARLKAGDTTAATQVGIPLEDFAQGLTNGIDANTERAVRAAIERAAFAIAANEAWIMLAILTALALLAVPFCRGSKPRGEPTEHSSLGTSSPQNLRV